MIADRFALRSALALILLISARPGFAHAPDPQAVIATELARGNIDRAIALAEAAVMRSPQDAAARATLGHAYVAAGRFASAASMLSDAVVLGETSSRTMLELALAQIASGDNRAARATLDQATTIAPAEYGLALALSGQTERGVGVLTDAVHDGAANARLRQNLAYAYALAGRWADARLTAGFDLPPGQVEPQLQQWAQSMQFGGERLRIARLLNAPLIADPGMPPALALNAAMPVAASPRVKPEQKLVVATLPRITAPLPTALLPTAPLPTAPLATAPAIASPALVESVPAPVQRAPVISGYIVQLGAFTSPQGAEKGRLVLAKLQPLLAGHGMQIVQTSVNRHSHWRVVAGGYDAASATDTCANLMRHGGECFAYPTPPSGPLALADLPVTALRAERR